MPEKKGKPKKPNLYTDELRNLFLFWSRSIIHINIGTIEINNDYVFDAK